jgi:hypothetical protein
MDLVSVFCRQIAREKQQIKIVDQDVEAEGQRMLVHSELHSADKPKITNS